MNCDTQITRNGEHLDGELEVGWDDSRLTPALKSLSAAQHIVKREQTEMDASQEERRDVPEVPLTNQPNPPLQLRLTSRRAPHDLNATT